MVNITVKKLMFFNFFFLGKIAPISLSIGLLEEGQRYRRSLQPSKDNNQHFKTNHFFTFSFFSAKKKHTEDSQRLQKFYVCGPKSLFINLAKLRF
jgi:hypothetical protein